MYKVAFHPIYVHPVPKNHRFPMEKYELLPQQLIYEGIIEKSQLFEPSQDMEYDFSIHDANYLNRLFTLNLSKKEERASGFLQSRQLIDREICITNGTIEASLNDGLAVVFEYENRIFEFSLTAKIKLDDGKRSNVSVIFSSLNSLLPDAS